MQWTDSGILLGLRKHGENSAIIHAFTREHGRAAGLVRGGAGRRLRGILQPGSTLRLTWRARLAEHLGTVTVEPEKSRAELLFRSADVLTAASSTLALLDVVLPEGEAHPALFEATVVLLDALLAETEAWPLLVARWELGLLGEIGYGLDLTRCAVTGEATDLVYVSPKSGRAVSRAAGAPYRDRLLPLPAFLRPAGAGEGGAEVTARDMLDALMLTGYFLDKFIATHYPKARLNARGRMMAALAERNGGST